jgi:hypothetical protein
MVDQYVKKLVDNLQVKPDKVDRLDVVLNGGAFNGSYLGGALSFLKEMEGRSYIKIERISGCSVGAIGGLLYWIDSLDLVPKLYDSMKAHFRNHFSLEVLKTLQQLLEDEGRIPTDLCERLNGKLFICYHDIKRNKKVIRSTYKSVDDIMEAIIKSSYVPFVFDHDVVYKKRYMDGVTAHIFPKEKGKKVLHLELLSLDRLAHSFIIKNEKNNFQRILEGLLDIHGFYVKQTSTTMCSYVNDWTLYEQTFYSFKMIIERMIVNTIWWIQYVRKYLPTNVGENVLVKIWIRVSFDIFSVLMETYCF